MVRYRGFGRPTATRARKTTRQILTSCLVLVIMTVLLAPLGTTAAYTLEPSSGPAAQPPAVVPAPSDNGPAPFASRAAPGQSEDVPAQHQAPAPFARYLVRLAEPNLIVATDTPSLDLADEALQRQRDDLESVLAGMAADGMAGAYTFDDVERAFSAELSESARYQLLTSPLVAAVDPVPAPTAGASASPAPNGFSIQSVSSVAFVQVYSPFMWGNASTGGLSVTLTLEAGNGITKAVASQTLAAPPNNYVRPERNRLYYETVFKDPNDPAHPPVNILPGDRVHIITSGIDPVTFQNAVEDRRIVVDDVRAWDSLEHDRISGIAPPGSNVIVTVGVQNYLSLDSYLTPGSSMTYADLTLAPDGTFSVDTFRTSSDPTYKYKTNLQKGSTGFVRVRHSNGDEVYTVHGQNVFVLENSYVTHGFAFSLPWQQGGLDSDFTPVSRPVPVANLTLKDSFGLVKDAQSVQPSGGPIYVATFNQMIDGGDTVEVSINGSPAMPITATLLTTTLDLGGNQLVGTGPANTEMVLGVGRISGYISASSYFDYLEKRINTGASGNYTSDQFQCGTGNYLSLRPGSFGYTGFEDSHGNFVYADFSAPTNHVMIDFSFTEGWVANGRLIPDITIRDSQGALKHQGTVAPKLLWMTGQKLYINVYYNLTTSQYISTGDVVTVTAGSQTSTIPVDKFTAYLNPDTDSVVGEAPAGMPVRVVPSADRSARKEVAADATGVYSAGNPFTNFASFNCTESTKTESFSPGDSGRAYLQHPDGNEVFANYGRSMHVNQNENYTELYLFVYQGIDWWGNTPVRPVTATLHSRQGTTTTVSLNAEAGIAGRAKVYFKDAQDQRVLIRAGDTITATFSEGPAGLTRPVTLSMQSLAQVTGSPDTDDSTLAGVGPRGWVGQATLSQPSNARPASLATGSYTAYPAFRFVNTSGAPITLVQGYNGTVSFSDDLGHRLWIAWAVTSLQVKITGPLRPSQTQVCGKAPPSSVVKIHDVTSESNDIIMSTTSSDGQGFYCATVPALYEGQVVMAESDGILSQPVIVHGIPDLATSLKSASAPSAPPGEVVTYTISLVNTGDGAAIGAALTDALPSSLTYLSGSALATAGTAGFGSGVVSWNGNVAYGGTETVTFAALVSPSAPMRSIITNTVVITDGNGVQTAKSAPLLVWRPRPDLSTSGTSVAPSTALPGANVTYTVSIVNTGDAAAAGARITDTLPVSLTYVNGSVAATAGTPGFSAGAITWTGDIAPGGMVTATFAAQISPTVPSGTVITNTVTIGDGNGVETSQSIQILAYRPIPNLTTSAIAVSPSTALPGSNATYTISIVNSGDGWATGARLTDTLPGSLTFQSGSVAATSGTTGYSAGVVTWTGDVAPGGIVTATFAAQVDPMLPSGSVIYNAVSIGDGNGVETSKSTPLSVYRPSPNLSTSVFSFTPTTTPPGSVVTYTVTIVNNGDAPAIGARLTSTIPISLTYVSGSASATSGTVGYSGGAVTWTGNVAIGWTETVRFSAVVNGSAPAGSNITNSAAIGDGDGTVVTKYASLAVTNATYHLYLPAIMRSPAGGW